MKRIVSAACMKAADRKTIERGMPSAVLMERAALSVVHEMLHRGMPAEHVIVLAGTGNNGGDGIAAARMLCERGYRPAVLLTGDPARYSPQMRQQLELLKWYDVEYVDSYEPGRYDTVIDALFGVGLSREITGLVRDLIETVNHDAAARVIAVDIPSGIQADCGAVLGAAIRAERTVTFAFGKTGLYLYPGAAYAGEVTVKEIGIPETSLDAPRRYLLEERDLALLPARKPDGNKGTYGKILSVTGSETICGAAYLASKACLMSGAGMVHILTASSNRIPLAASFPEALISTWESGCADCTQYAALLSWADGVLIGPGIGRGDMAQRLLKMVLDQFRGPVVLDADALNLLADHPELMTALDERCVVTPHIVEMSRLTGKSVGEIKAAPFEAAEQFAAAHHVVCVLKDARTVIAYPDGTSFLLASGSSALATAGSGDVLAGITAALTVQHPAPQYRAAALAALVHALSGREAASGRSEASVLAGSILDYLHVCL